MLLASLFLAAAVAAPSPKTSVMVVGVAHLVSKRDVHNSVFTDSPLSPKRQAQVAEVVERLARFRPTKVLIEGTYGDGKWAQRYAQYLQGRYTLGKNEIYQFGFKLAARAGNPTIYPVDTFGPQLYPDGSPTEKRIDSFIEAHFKSVKDPLFDAFLARSDEIEKNGTYLELLQYLNATQAIRANASWYAMFARLGQSTDNAGAAYVAGWYVRNTYIFSNILNTIKPGDRVVIFIGQGHAYLLRDFIDLNPDLVDVDPLPYLK